ncbi:hypothetical protein FRC01_005475, partial [Tulasnella sp. 417]
LAAFYNRYFEQMEYTGRWVVAVGGWLIVCMAVLNTVQRRPRNQFAWGYSLNRFFIGFTMIVVGARNVGSTWIDDPKWMIWILPTVGIGYGVAVAVDRSILFFSIRSIWNLEALSRSNIAYSNVEKGDYEHGTGVDLAQLPHLPYGHGLLHRSESPPAGMHAQDPTGSSASSYSEGEGTEKLHHESQYHLPYKP